MSYYQKNSIKYEKYLPDLAYKAKGVSTSKIVNMVAIDLCDECIKRASSRLEAKITTGRQRPFMKFITKFNNVKSEQEAVWGKEIK